jgi:Flp pilus assembly pilin Flp
MWSQGVQYARRRAGRLLADEHGQDLIEYALLTGIIALAWVIAFPPLKDRMKAAYQAWNANVQAIWVPPPPM